MKKNQEHHRTEFQLKYDFFNFFNVIRDSRALIVIYFETELKKEKEK